MALKVLYPYITLKCTSPLDGSTILRELYAGATVPEEADPADVERLKRKGALVDEHDDAAVLAVPAGTPIPGEPPNVPVTEQPAIAVPLADRVEAQRTAAQAARPRPPAKAAPRSEPRAEPRAEQKPDTKADGKPDAKS